MTSTSAAACSPRPACGERSIAKRSGEGESPRGQLSPSPWKAPLTLTLSPQAGRGKERILLELRLLVIAAVDQDLLPIVLVDHDRLQEIGGHGLDAVLVG